MGNLFLSALIVSTAIITSLLYILKSWRKKSLSFRFNKFDLVLILFGGSLLFTNLINHSYPQENFATWGVLFLSFLALNLTLPVLLKKRKKLIKTLVIIEVLAFIFYLLFSFTQAHTPLSVSMAVTIKTWQSPKQILLGVGNNKIANVLNQYRPLWINGHRLWNTNFTQGTNYFFDLYLGSGILPLFFYLLLIFYVIKNYPPSILVFLLTLLLPNTIYFSSLLFALLITYSLLRPYSLKRIDFQGKFIFIIFRVLLLVSALLIIGSCFLYGRILLAKFIFYRSTLLGTTQISQIYQLQQRAIQLYPYSSELRHAYAVTNLNMAAALMQKSELNEVEKTQLSKIMSQTIREAKICTQIDSGNFSHWQFLGEVYNNLSGLVKDAPAFAIESYAEAIRRSPQNPILYLSLGKTYYEAGNYEQAQKVFEASLQIKPDLSAIYYHLARTFRELKK